MTATGTATLPLTRTDTATTRFDLRRTSRTTGTLGPLGPIGMSAVRDFDDDASLWHTDVVAGPTAAVANRAPISRARDLVFACCVALAAVIGASTLGAAVAAASPATTVVSR